VVCSWWLLVIKRLDKMESASFESLIVWQKAMEYTEYCIAISEDIAQKNKGHYRILEQLESSSLSVPQNIAEGKGRYSTKEFLQFLYYSRGSLNESLTILLLFYRRNWITEEQINEARKMAYELGSLLNAFITGLKKKLK
jgi:four helix bundle protein